LQHASDRSTERRHPVRDIERAGIATRAAQSSAQLLTLGRDVAQRFTVTLERDPAMAEPRDAPHQPRREFAAEPDRNVIDMRRPWLAIHVFEADRLRCERGWPARPQRSASAERVVEAQAA